jgi:hypothetical protein
MEISSDDDVTIHLSHDEAFVLFDFVWRVTEQNKLSLEDPAEKQLFGSISCDLETRMVQPFEPGYYPSLARARTAVCRAFSVMSDS